MTNFHGKPVLTLKNDRLQLDVLTAGGLRIIRLRLAGSSKNLLVEAPNNHWPTSHGEYYLLGGHRLWAAPEIPERTYIPDAAEVLVEELEDGLRLTTPTEAPTGLQKSIHVALDPASPSVILNHTIVNRGNSPIELAVWAITALPLGGTIILPETIGPASSLQPNRNLVLWPYTCWTDPRLHLADKYITLQASPSLPPCKVGYFNTHGWVGYLHNGTLFLKRFKVYENQPHTDRGCNVEAYCSDRLAELETLSPLTILPPGDSAHHIETWELFTNQPINPSPEELLASLQQMGTQYAKNILP